MMIHERNAFVRFLIGSTQRLRYAKVGMSIYRSRQQALHLINQLRAGKRFAQVTVS